MTLSLWAAFVAASSILLVIPGPTVLPVVSYALGQGWRTALKTRAKASRRKSRGVGGKW
jgi:threonine/homoserine/homoserine lactone efflux protein